MVQKATSVCPYKLANKKTNKTFGGLGQRNGLKI